MGWHRTGLTLALSLACACGGDDGAEAANAVEERPTTEAATAERPPSLLDAEGNLRESDEVLVGLTLPVGLEEQPTTGDRLHRYRAPEVELDAMLAYFGPRLITGQVDRVGAGAVFREAAPRNARGGVVKLDVAIHPSAAGGTRLEIEELPPQNAARGAKTQALDPAAVRRAEEIIAASRE